MNNCNLKFRTFYLTFLFSFLTAVSFSQLTVSTAMSPQQLVQNILVGSGVTVTNVTYSGVAGSIGYFQGGNTTNLGLDEGIIMSTGVVNGTPAIGSGGANFASTSNNTGGDAQLQALVSDPVYDASVLQFDFNPLSDTIKFRYVFGSEEYPEFVNSGYNDIFGFFVSGPNPSGGTYTNVNVAKIPGTSQPVSIDNVNAGSYAQYYVSNGSGATIVWDGFTTVLTAWCKVVPCQQYHIKLAIGDVGDHIYDSGVFLEANSFSTSGIAYNLGYSSNIDTMAVEGCNDAIIRFNLSQPATDTLVLHYTKTGTATEGADYPALPDSLVIYPGEDSAMLVIAPYADGNPETVETVLIAYQNTSCGSIDTIIILIKDYEPILVSCSNDVYSCSGTPANISVTASGGYTPLTYLWNDPTANTTTSLTVNPANPRYYTVSVSDACNFIVKDSVKVSISNLQTTITNIDSVSCYGYNDGAITISASNGLVPYQYNWSNSQTTPNIGTLTTGTYTVTVTDSIGCTSVQSIVLMDPPQIQVSLTPEDETCVMYCNGKLTANITGANAPPYSYSWSTIPPQNTAAAINLCPGNYTVTVTYSPNNCKMTATADIITETILDASFTADKMEGYVPVTVNFTFTGHGASTYAWDFGDGGTSTVQNPSHTYTNMGVYHVKLVINSGSPNFCQAEHNMIFTAIQPSSIQTYNVITPNGDGQNDEFTIESEGIRTIKVLIYNRWGEKVYSYENNDGFSNLKEKTKLWTGTNMKGGNCSDGTYFFIIDAQGYDMQVYHLNGNVTLIR
jgi:gliding motility-associated-like protein